MNLPIWRGGKFTTAKTCRPELESRLACLRIGLDLDDRAGADVDLIEIIENDRRPGFRRKDHRAVRRIAGNHKGAGLEPGEAGVQPEMRKPAGSLRRA
jgi:hypothetical protein